MDGVLVNGKRFIPMNAIQVIDMESKTIYYRDNQEDYNHGQRFERQIYEKYETCEICDLSSTIYLKSF